MHRLWQVTLITSTIVSCWLAAQVVHEAGHAIHAVVSGAKVVAVELHPLHFSRTVVAPNPGAQKHFIVWGGVIWGSVLPVAAYAVARALRWRYAYLLRFFAGFCLVMNGGYLVSGIVVPAGDTEDLLRLGVPSSLLLVGLLAVTVGLWLWNGQGPQFGLGSGRGQVDRKAAVAMCILAAGIAILEFWAAAPRGRGG